MKIKVVIIHHQNNRRQFTFRVPESVDIEAGDIVLCDTSMGKGQVGYCITPSYYVPEEKVQDLLNVSPKNLKPIVGRLTPVMFMYEVPDEKENNKK